MRKASNPTAHDWPDGFLRGFVLSARPAGWDALPRRDERHLKRLSALLARQPLTRVRLDLPALSTREEDKVGDYLAWLATAENAEGVTFYRRGEERSRPLPTTEAAA
jgi:hypothetical protein